MGYIGFIILAAVVIGGIGSIYAFLPQVKRTELKNWIVGLDK